LPPDGGPNNCSDENWLYQSQVAYLSTLVTQLNHDLTSTLEGLKDSNVAVADVSGAYTPTGENDQWCQPDPWAHGLSIYSVYSPSSFKSQAPFHPTPDGQASIANYVIPTLLKLFGGPLPSSPTAPTTAPSTTSSAPSSTATSSSSPPSGSTPSATG